MVLMHKHVPVAVFGDWGRALSVCEACEELDSGYWLWSAIKDPDVTLEPDWITFEGPDGDETTTINTGGGECRASGTAAPRSLVTIGNKKEPTL